METDEITKQKMEDIAQGLGPKVGGRHSRRNLVDSAEMRYILSDWFRDNLCNIGGDESVQKLVELFESEDVSLKPLAARMKSYLEKKKETIQTKVCKKLGDDVIDIINHAVKNGAVTKDKMSAIAKGLGLEEEHKKRGKFDNLEMGRILRDWFRKDLYVMDSERALNVLAKILENDEVDLKDLATKLKGTTTRVFRKEDVVIVDSLKNSHNVFKTLLLIGKTGSGKSSL